MKAPITDGAGFVGSHFADELLRRGQQDIALNDLSMGRQNSPAHLLGRLDFGFVLGTILNADLLDDVVERCDMDFHRAAGIGHNVIVQRLVESLRTNAMGSVPVIEKCHKHTCPVLVAPASAISVSVPLVVLAVPILDTALVTVARMLDGGSPFQSGAAHVSRRVRLDLLVPGVVGIVCGAGIFSGWLAIGLSRQVDGSSAYLRAAFWASLMAFGGWLFVRMAASVAVAHNLVCQPEAAEVPEAGR